MYNNAKLDLDYAIKFTETYQNEQNISKREAACLALQVPYVLSPIGKDDLIVGIMNHGFVGFSTQKGGVYTYYFHEHAVKKALDSIRLQVDEAYIQKIERIRDFWRTENTESRVNARYKERYPKERLTDFYFAVCRIAGMMVDLDLLVQLGLNGLKERNRQYRAINGVYDFYDALDLSIDIISDACVNYAAQARELMTSASEERRKELAEISKIFDRIAYNKPENFKEALQLVWIYGVCSDLMNYGRMDNYLGELYARDIDSGIITEDEAIRWLSSMYRNIIVIGKIHDTRIIIGGMGRKNPTAANRLALLLIKVSRIVLDVVPQLTLRYYNGMDERLMEETLLNIESGAVYPIVYSDETTVPAIEQIYHTDRTMACNWVPLGCGEYILEGYGPATPNSILTIPIALDLVLHRGVNSFNNRREWDELPDPAAYKTFEELFEAYGKLLLQASEEMAYHEKLNYSVAAEQADFLHMSLLTHDCVEKGKALLNGGSRYLAATIEVFGAITCADSLMAIKHCVYDRKYFTLSELIHMCDMNFEGYERERKILQNAPKYGNDNDEADAMAVKVFNHVAGLHEEAKKYSGLDVYKVCSVNNSGSSDRGAKISATPCGRLRGTALSNGNSPSIGADKNGLTATLNSMAKFDPKRHVGVVHNIRFNKNLLKKNRTKIRMVLETFFKNNGVQSNLSSIGKDDLEQALLHPENYKNLIVRIGGFSARFVELDKNLQTELVARTTYEEI